MFSVLRSPRAVPATPEERLGASAEHLPEACCLRPLCRGSASPCSHEATSEFATRYGPRLRNHPLASGRHTGPASAGHLTTSRRGPSYPIAQRFIGVGSFHPTRNTPLSRRTQSSVRAAAIGGAKAGPTVRDQTDHARSARSSMIASERDFRLRIGWNEVSGRSTT